MNTFDYEISLIKEIITKNKYKQEKIERQEKKVLAIKKSVGRDDFFKGKNVDLQLDITLVINEFEYEDEKELIFESKIYKVIRTYSRNDGLIELTCEEVKLV